MHPPPTLFVPQNYYLLDFNLPGSNFVVLYVFKRRKMSLSNLISIKRFYFLFEIDYSIYHSPSIPI